ncbi:VOC family protein [Brevundimonas lenta]|uniref:Catechol 2,3-dioxygenase-like lactoylglutathione lyase family enzyme n=1 Tax=Brevundimonas lenta TaxID=424796 RepID=A0A7W6NQU1_9CAUL|nr:VOC family protein [Brevundimonas lenta]MBB4083989.1 catechol 2,3-dioxygenase-like lactoylglutathione lyase family enzyme [Brevundimonas lenta]
MTTPSGTRPPLVSHVSVGVSDVARAGAFFDAVMAPLGARRIMEHAVGIGYGRSFPEFWAARPHDGGPSACGNGTHICFNADGPDAVAAFHAAGLAAGGTDDGAPGPRPEYAPGYYAAFLRDPDGNKVEAMCWIAPSAAS